MSKRRKKGKKEKKEKRKKKKQKKKNTVTDFRAIRGMGGSAYPLMDKWGSFCPFWTKNPPMESL